MTIIVIKSGINMRAGLDFTALKIFCAVVDKGSFVAAAKALAMPTSNVSRTVARLEEMLNVQLIERTTRHRKLTPSGQLLYTRSKPLLESLEQTEAELMSRQVQLKGPLRICIPSEMGPALLGDLLAEFACRYPALEISCITNLSGFESLREEVDVAVIVTRGELDDSDYIARPLATFPCTIVAAPALIEHYGLPVSIRQFETLPCITTVSALNGAAWQFVDAAGKHEVVNVKGHYRVNSGEMAFKAALAGVGFAILSNHACRQPIDEGRLVEIAFPEAAAPLRLVAIYSSRRYLPVKTRALIDFLQQGLQSPVD